LSGLPCTAADCCAQGGTQLARSHTHTAHVVLLVCVSDLSNAECGMRNPLACCAASVQGNDMLDVMEATGAGSGIVLLSYPV
jgi:hypothetical protein